MTWAPAGSTDDIDVDISGDCFIDTMENLSGDPGTYTFEAGSLESRGRPRATAVEAKITLTKTRTGTLDPAFEEGGKVHGTQVRVLNVRIDP